MRPMVRVRRVCDTSTGCAAASRRSGIVLLRGETVTERVKVKEVVNCERYVERASVELVRSASSIVYGDNG